MLFYLGSFLQGYKEKDKYIASQGNLFIVFGLKTAQNWLLIDGPVVLFLAALGVQPKKSFITMFTSCITAFP